MSFQTAHSYHFHRFSESVSQTNVVTVYQRDSSSSEAVTRTSEPSSDPLYVLTIPPPPTLFKAFNLSTRVYIGPSPGCVLIPQKSDYKPLHCELKIPALETPRINQHFIFSIDSTPPVTFTCHEYNVKTPLTTDQSPVKCVFSWNSVPTRWRQVTLGANNDIAQFVLEVQAGPHRPTSYPGKSTSKATNIHWEVLATASCSRSLFYTTDTSPETKTVTSPEFARITYTDATKFETLSDLDLQIHITTFFQTLLGDILNREGRLETVILTRIKNARHEYVSPLARVNTGPVFWPFIMDDKKQTVTVSKDALEGKKKGF